MKVTLNVTLLLIPFLASVLQAKRPNILFIFSDDHALRSISAYGGDLAKVAPTPNIDRLAASGAIFENSFCGNSICGPSRATILTGKHSHKNGFLRNSRTGLDQSQWTIAKALQGVGYHTAVIGKWHLISKPVGFDHWEVLPGQGNYYNPVFLQGDGGKKQFTGYCTDITTDKAIAWLDQRDKKKPFFLMCQHKAPHRTFAPALRHLNTFDGVAIPEPPTLFDDYKNRSKTLAENEMEIDRHFHWTYDAKVRKDERNGIELPGPDRHGMVEYRRMNPEQKKQWDACFGPENEAFLEKVGSMSHREIVQWKYQRYMKNYLGTVQAVDDSVGRMLDYLEDHDLADNTIVIYASDQGFYLGEHGWYDKRWMFEESFKMPFVIRWPGITQAGSRPMEMIQNIDYAPTFLDAAGVKIPDEIQGRSIVPILKGKAKGWRQSLYYSYYEKGEHNVPQHFGVRTQSHKLFYLPQTDEWQMFDLINDPREMRSVYGEREYATVQRELTKEFYRLREHYEAPPFSENK
ncbi:MAG: sulfatase [Akkermansiaceae bacterium]